MCPSRFSIHFMIGGFGSGVLSLPINSARVLVHPDHGPLTVDWLLFQYAWHGRHHIAHITDLRKQKSW